MRPSALRAVMLMGVAILNHFQNVSDGPFNNIEIFYKASELNNPSVTLKANHQHAIAMISYGASKSSSILYWALPTGFMYLTAGDKRIEVTRGLDIRTGAASSSQNYSTYSFQNITMSFTGTEIQVLGCGVTNVTVLSGFAFD